MNRDKIVAMLKSRGIDVLPELTEEDRLLKLKEVSERIKYRTPSVQNLSEDELKIQLEKAMNRMYNKGNKVD